MFTGIVETLGTVEVVRDLGDAVRLTISDEHAHVLADASLGDSIAVNGCCLTVAHLSFNGHEPEAFEADVMAETLAKTTIGRLAEGDEVNLERAVRADQRLGGHLVQGHVDGVGTIASRAPSAHWDVVAIAIPEELARYLVPKGSVTVDGVSLTVVEVGPDRFTVSLIPETLARTTLGRRKVGDQVNIEVDVLAKYVERLLAPRTDRNDSQEVR
ncbi:MAG: riboflavin synthase [Nocardioides sp.]